ncbi:MAG: hypothetical protein H6R19_2686 [Proteobacteria bacterium]|nr:hypothetical protein [Pseudomonadota bacterium]
MFVFLHADVLKRLCADQDDREHFVRAMLWWPDAILRTLPFEPRMQCPEPRIVLIPPEYKGDYCQEELVICCTRFGFVEKITLRAYFALTQMRMDQKALAGQ